MKKRHQSYIVTFCSSGAGGSSSSVSSAGGELQELSTMERKQDSSTDLLIDSTGQHGDGSVNIVKMEEDCGGGGGGAGGSNMEGNNTTVARIKDKFRGCLLGALVGDCIGTLFERDYSVSYTLLEDLYHSLTNLSEDEKLMDLHGIDLTLGQKRIREILETKRQSCASGTMSMETLEESDVASRLKPYHHEGMYLRRNSAITSGTASTIMGPLGGGGSTSASRRGSFSRPIEKYSDDTVMTKSVLYSLIASKGFDARHLAKQLTEDYFLNMNRKFGGYIRDIFVQLRENGYQDPYSPAKKYSGGIGAQGNEAASRVSPIALFCWGQQESHQVLMDLASKTAKITNAHRTSVHGTILQSFAVHTAFNWELQGERRRCSSCGQEQAVEEQSQTSTASTSSRHGSPLLMRRRGSLHHSARNSEVPQGGPRILIEQQPKYFCEQILERMSLVEGRASSLFENLKHLVHHSVGGTKEFLKPTEPTYCDKLRVILEFLQRSQPPTRIEIIERLGNGFKAIDSVPTAVYSFLFASKCDMLPEMTTPIKSPVLRTIFHAVSLGGETDTLASMAGAMAGAYWGYSQIPDEILRVCEGSSDILKLADELFNVILKNKMSNMNTLLCQSCMQVN